MARRAGGQRPWPATPNPSSGSDPAGCPTCASRTSPLVRLVCPARRWRGSRPTRSHRTTSSCPSVPSCLAVSPTRGWRNVGSRRRRAGLCSSSSAWPGWMAAGSYAGRRSTRPRSNPCLRARSAGRSSTAPSAAARSSSARRSWRAQTWLRSTPPPTPRRRAMSARSGTSGRCCDRAAWTTHSARWVGR